MHNIVSCISDNKDEKWVQILKCMIQYYAFLLSFRSYSRRLHWLPVKFPIHFKMRDNFPIPKRQPTSILS